MKRVLALSLSAVLLSASPVFAKVAMAERVASVLAPNSAGCMTENAQISISFTGVDADAAAIKPKFDTKLIEIEKLMKASGLSKFEIQAMNYSISPQNYGNMGASYQFNNSISYTVFPASKAADVMAELTKKGYQASVNVSSYRNSGVACGAAPAE